MRILIIGGSEFLGRAFTEAALAAGHEVTTFNRGKSGPDVTGVEAVRGDRTSEADLARLVDGRDWDAVVDTCGYAPSIVGLSARALAGKAATYLFISTCSVFAEWPDKPIGDESPTYECSPDAGPDDGDYGTLKVGCERVVDRDFPGRTLHFRAGLILGPHENIGRLPTWLKRIAEAGTTRDLRVVAPGNPDAPMRMIDARDIALFGLRCLENPAASGAYIVAPPPENTTTYGDWLADCVDATGSPAELVWVSDEVLAEHEVGAWREMPLWLPANESGDEHLWWALDASRAVQDGLECRPLRETVQDTWAWMAADDGHVLKTYVSRDPYGISEERERAVLATWDALGESESESER